MKKIILSVVSDAVMIIFFFVLVIQMLFCILIGKKSWLEQRDENLYGERGTKT